MQNKLFVYNTLTKNKEEFKPIKPPFVGMYVCGPTVYGDAHLGHAKSYLSFDLVYRYLLHLGYKVRYVQNITDVGHLTDDGDAGDDKIIEQSKLEQIEPMEVVERYMGNYYRDMDALNILRPSIAPRPSGHIPEQIEAIQELINKGLAYEKNGSVYFDVKEYDKNHEYGKLSGRTLDGMISGAAKRELQSQIEKKNSFDFALWKKAEGTHLMQWNSPWGNGFPGWHIECTVMSQKYLGENFDIHGGGLENAFPHHECEIAQAEGLTNKTFANYWLHNNMVTINGQKMGKSLGNGVFCHELFSGENDQLDQPYSPMSVRFFILQSHYRSTLDFSNDALKASEKGLKKLLKANETIAALKVTEKGNFDAVEFRQKCYAAMNDDFNSPVLIAHLFDGLKYINSVATGKETIDEATKKQLKEIYQLFVYDVLGLKEETENKTVLPDQFIKLLLEIRDQLKSEKNYVLSDKIRDELTKLDVTIKDGKEGSSYEF